MGTCRRGVLTVAVTDGVGVAAAGAIGSSVLGGAAVDGLVLFVVPAMAPPMMAAAMIMPTTIANSVQKCRRRKPHIFRGFGSGGVTGKASATGLSFTSELYV